MIDKTEHVESHFKENHVREEGNILIAVIVTILLFFISMIVVFGLGLNTTQVIIFVILIVVFYIIVLSFLFEHRLVKEIANTFVRTVGIENTNVNTRTIIKTVDRPVIYEVEKPIIRDVIRTVDRPVFIKGNRLNIPKYDFIGSSETMTYHKKSCRLSRLIKKKYSVNGNDPRWFIKNKYQPCKVCILKERKA